MSQYVEYGSLRFTNDFVFCHVLIENPELCKKIAELAIGRKIKEIKTPQTQKSIKESPDGKGVRFDVVFEDDESTVYDIEMQQADLHNLPQRTRYYQSLIDLDTLRAGKDYKSITNSYIIFICDFDPFDKGCHRYIARTSVEGFDDVSYDDGIVKVFLNSHYSDNVNDRELKEFLDYVKWGIIREGFTTELQDAVKRVLSDEERRAEYMFLTEKFAIYEEQGIKQGIKQGEKQGEKKLAELMQKLFALGRNEDAVRAASDPAFREQLYQEFAIV